MEINANLTSQISRSCNFQRYDRRAEYLLSTDSIEQYSTELPAVIASTKFGRHFSARSLAIEFERWENENGEDTMIHFVQSKICSLPLGVEPSLKHDEDVRRVVAALKRGIMARCLEAEANNPAVSVLMAWNIRMFEHSVGRKGIELCIKTLKTDSRFKKISELLVQWQKHIDPVQEAIDGIFNAITDLTTMVSSAPAAVPDIQQQNPPQASCQQDSAGLDEGQRDQAAGEEIALFSPMSSHLVPAFDGFGGCQSRVADGSLSPNYSFFNEIVNWGG